VDIIIHCLQGGLDRGIVLIERRNPPLGWALPGGFIDYGEAAEEAAVREAKEETGLEVILLGLLGVYSRPDRDPRQHTMSTVYWGWAEGRPQAADDALNARIFTREQIPKNLCFDHAEILDDYFRLRAGLEPRAR